MSLSTLIFKKKISVFTTFLLFLISGCSVTPNNEGSSSETSINHNHTYDLNNWDFDANKHWHPSTCGHDVRKDEEEHTFTSVVTEPTIYGGGYTTYTCSKCGFTYEDDYIERIKYTVTWLDWDGTLLETEQYIYNGLPRYKRRQPIRSDESGQIAYQFTGWSPELKPVTEDATYTATYSEELLYSIIKFDLNGGTTSSDSSPIHVKALYGSNLFFDVRKEGFNFRGWECNGVKVFDHLGNKLVDLKLEKEMTFKAIFEGNVCLTITYIKQYNFDNLIYWGGTCTGDGYYPYNTLVDLTAVPWDGYVFKGWYLNGVLISNSLNFQYMLWTEDVVIQTAWDFEVYSIDYIVDGEKLGSNFGGRKEYVIESEFDLIPYHKVGYTFLYWELYGEPIYKITKGMMGDIVLNGVYEINTYSISVLSNDISKGTVSDSFIADYGEEVTIKAFPAQYCEFNGWYLYGEFISDSPEYTFTIDAKDMVFVANFSYKTSTLNIASAQSTLGNVMIKGKSELSPSLETKARYKDSITIYAIGEENTNFIGWFDSNNELVSNKGTYAFEMPCEDYCLFAKWEVPSTLYHFELTSSDNFKGTVEGAGFYKYGDIVNCVASAKENSNFCGWYEDNQKISKKEKHIFTMPQCDYCLMGLFKTDGEIALERLNGISPVFSNNNKTLSYGLYPQKRVTDEELISRLDALEVREANGYYLLDNSYYAKLEAKPVNGDYTFDDGNQISEGSTYWFKCSAIEWNILKKNQDEYLVLSKYLLNCKVFSELKNSNVYSTSFIRSWLNNEFYDSAFGLNDEFIETTLVDNSWRTNYSAYYAVDCEDTIDKVFLLSYQDYINEDYGFSASSSNLFTRYAKVTDYAKADGANCLLSNDDLYNNGRYWTRSGFWSHQTYVNLGMQVYVVNSSGYVDPNEIYGYYGEGTAYRGNCARPAMTLNLENL